MPNRAFWRVRSRGFAKQGERQALAFEAWRRGPAPNPRTLADVIAEICDASRSPAFTAGGQSFALAEMREKHGVIDGPTDTGKTSLAHLLLVNEIFEAAARTVAHAMRTGADLDEAPLDLEVLVVDPKDDVPLLKGRITARYRRSSEAIRRVLRGAFRTHEWRGARASVWPLTRRWPGVSVEYQAETQVAIVALTSPDDWTGSMRHVVWQVLRLLQYRGDPADPIHITRILTDERYRLSLLDDCPTDLAEYFRHLKKRVAPQTIAAIVRRIEALFGYPHVCAMLGLPPRTSVIDGEKPRRVVLADCGVHSALPPTIRIAQANAIITEFGLTAGGRDQTVALIAYIEEALHLLAQDSALLARFIDQLRLLRSARVALWFSVQKLESFPKSAVDEMIENAGWVVSFRGAGSLVSTIYGHLLVDPTDMRPDPERRRAFEREMEALPRQELVIWKKAAPAIRARTLEAPGLDGVPLEELVAQFDAELAPRSTISLIEADRILASWRAAHVPDNSTPNPKPAKSLRDIFVAEEEEE